MHDIDHEEWCAAIAAGDVEGVPAELVKAIEACPECSPRLAGLRELQSTLARVGADDREIVAAARAMKPLAGERVIAERLRELGGALDSRSAPAQRVVPWRRQLLALAACLMVGCLGFWAWRAGRSNAPRPDEVLGDSEFEYVSPIGPQKDKVPFVWRYPLPADWYFIVTVRLADGAAGELVESPKLRANTWTPSAEDWARIKGEFRWSVQPFDASREPQPSGPWFSASFPP